MDITAEQISNALDGRRVRDGEYKARCCAHDDKSPSLSISQAAEKVLLKCWSGCSQGEVISALRSRGLWHKERERTAPYNPPLTQGQRDYLTSFVLIYRGDANKAVVHREADTLHYWRCLSKLQSKGVRI